jgi:protein-S-isoprenylcysteine O-methyltransferase Ste14
VTNHRELHAPRFRRPKSFGRRAFGDPVSRRTSREAPVERLSGELKMAEADLNDHPGVRIIAPIVYGGFLLIGLILQYIFPVPAFLPTLIAWVAGWLICVASLFFIVPAMRSFRSVRTTMIPYRPVSSLVTGGVYSVTRNPMYVSLLLLYLGISVALNFLWPIALVPALIVAMDRLVIVKEEAYLTRRFGDEYRRYRERVRRWF